MSQFLGCDVANKINCQVRDSPWSLRYLMGKLSHHLGLGCCDLRKVSHNLVDVISIVSCYAGVWIFFIRLRISSDRPTSVSKKSHHLCLSKRDVFLALHFGITTKLPSRLPLSPGSLTLAPTFIVSPDLDPHDHVLTMCVARRSHGQRSLGRQLLHSPANGTWKDRRLLHTYL